MAINYNGNNVDNVIYNGQQVERVIYNGNLVWENWVYKTGNLYVMTSNTTPSGYTLTYGGYKDSGETYYAFDADVNSAILITGTSNKFVSIEWNRPIRIVGGAFRVGFDSSTTLQIQAKNGDGVWVDIYLQSSVGYLTGSFTSTVNTTEFYGIRIFTTAYGSYWRVYDLKVTTWYQKGA